MNEQVPYTATAEEVLRDLEVDPAAGLSPAAVQASRTKHGENSFMREGGPSLARRIFEAASEPMIVMLIAAALIALIVNIIRAATGDQADFLECVGIFAAISLSVVITVVMEGRSAKAFEALNKINEDTLVKAVRDGSIVMLPQREVVVGDILHIETGDKIVADGRLVESGELKADESALTGESMPVKKYADLVLDTSETPVAERANMLYSGSYITGGHGILVVTAVGDGTEFGKIARELSATVPTTTPLQEKLARLGKTITILGVIAAAAVFLVQLVIFLIHGTATLANISESFIESVVLIVAAVPEGLPTIVAVSLSINIIKMSRQAALVKKMIACETVGCINVICSDKTGTLTENRMTVVKIYDATGEEPRIVEPSGLLAEAASGNHAGGSLLVQNFTANSTADVVYDSEKPSFIGNPTEGALLVAAHDAGVDYKTCRKTARIVYTYPFSSEEKDMTTVVADGEDLLALTKGSPERIFDHCGLAGQQRAQVEAEVTRFQESAYRIIAFAHKKFAACDGLEEKHREVESDMTFDGFVAITDPLRADVPAAVERCREAGVGLKMLTGDNIVTATAIAKELDMFADGGIAVEAKEIEATSDEALPALLGNVRVIARSTPAVKMRVVNALKASGDVVAVTGDGINDAPALKNADVGIAMGISGTDVSKEASDIVLLDDSFSTIVKAVQWGRGIYQNFQRFIQFQLTVNLSSVIVVLTTVLLGIASPFSALQLLWVNIVMDGPPALTLGLEPIRDDLMKDPPTRRDANIVSRGMLARIAINGVFISVVSMAQELTNFMGATAAQAGTVLFTTFVLFQLFNAFNCRELTHTSIFKNITKNRLMLGVFAITFLLQVLITQVGGAFFGTVALPAAMWLKMIAVALSIVVVSEVAKLIFRTVAKMRTSS